MTHSDERHANTASSAGMESGQRAVMCAPLSHLSACGKCGAAESYSVADSRPLFNTGVRIDSSRRFCQGHFPRVFFALQRRNFPLVPSTPPPRSFVPLSSRCLPSAGSFILRSSSSLFLCESTETFVPRKQTLSSCSPTTIWPLNILAGSTESLVCSPKADLKSL